MSLNGEEKVGNLVARQLILLRKIMKKNCGIWLDNKQAFIVTLENQNAKLERLLSEVEDFRPVGGYGGANASLGQDAVSESKMLARKKAQLKKYFQRIIDAVADCEKLVVIGPAQAKIEFEKELAGASKFKGELVAVETADSMTENQVVSKIKGYFED